jgi:hypothetical protein
MTEIAFHTGTERVEEIQADAQDDMQAIPVKIQGTEEVRTAKYRSTHTVSTISAGDPLPTQRLLPQAPKRHRAVVKSRPLLAAETMEYVLIGAEAQVNVGRGYQLWNGESVVIESSSSMFIGQGTTPTTHPISVSVIDERFE